MVKEKTKKNTVVVEVENDVHRELKIFAAETGESLSALATKAIRELLKKANAKKYNKQ